LLCTGNLGSSGPYAQPICILFGRTNAQHHQLTVSSHPPRSIAIDSMGKGALDLSALQALSRHDHLCLQLGCYANIDLLPHLTTLDLCNADAIGGHDCSFHSSLQALGLLGSDLFAFQTMGLLVCTNLRNWCYGPEFGCCHGWLHLALDRIERVHNKGKRHANQTGATDELKNITTGTESSAGRHCSRKSYQYLLQARTVCCRHPVSLIDCISDMLPRMH